jgi:putative restriction endonuclease
VDLATELGVREDMFRHLDRLSHERPEGQLTWKDTGEPFISNNQSFTMRQVRGRGIHHPPALMAALSITTAFTPPEGRRPYADDFHHRDGFLRYHYEGDDPDLASNRFLRRASDLRVPLVYFVGVAAGLYKAVYPIYIIGEDLNALSFVVGHQREQIGLDLSSMTDIARRYARRETYQRLHQPIFREQVMEAYARTCTVCHLRHAELLDAAHIIGDADEGGDPVVTNGLALCKIHHAAYDRGFLGITPDYSVRINSSLLDEVDGPMLRHGLQEMHGATIHLPRRREHHPDRGRLDQRYQAFLTAS